METFHTWAEIDLNAFHDNITYYRENTDKEVMLVLKANAYGHGDIVLAQHAESWGFHHFAVASIDEGIHLRKYGIQGYILVLGPTILSQVEKAIEHNIVLTIPSLDYAKSLPDHLDGLKVHIKIDSGMHRIGIRTLEEFKETIQCLQNKNITIEGAFSHYAKSDEKTDLTTLNQYEFYKHMIEESGFPFQYIHIANSNAITSTNDSLSNMVRAGIGIYGYSVYDKMKPVLSLYTRLTQVKKIEANEGVGYGLEYVSQEPEWIGTVSIGYADGWNRMQKNQSVYIDGTITHFVGKICMDQSMIHLDKEYPLDTPVELIGPHISLVERATTLGTIPHEILTSISERVPRLFLEDGKLIEIDYGRFEHDH